MSSTGSKAKFASLAALVVAASLAGCRKVEMHEQEYKEAYERSDLFADGNSSRPIVEGTVVRGQPRTDVAFFTGVGPDGKAVAELPWQMTEQDLLVGKSQYEIYCYVCHGQTGYGDGMIVRRGFVRPQSFHAQRLKDAPVGYYYQVITNGFGAMYSYAERVTPDDRWRVAAYIKTLQMSQGTPVAALDAESRDKVARGVVEGKNAPSPAGAQQQSGGTGTGTGQQGY